MNYSKNAIKWSLTVFIPLVLNLFLLYYKVDASIRSFLTITLIGILMFLFEQVPMLVTSLLLMTTYVVFNIAPMSIVFSGWLQESIWITFGCLVMVIVLKNTTLVERVTYRLIILSGGTYLGILFALVGLGIITNLLVPGVMVGVMIAALAFSLCQILEFGKSKASAGIMIGALCVGFYDVETFILSPGNYTLLIDSAKQLFDIPINYWIFFKDNWVFMPIIILEVLILNKMFAPKEFGNVKAKFETKLANLGKVSHQEKKMVIILLSLLIYLFSQPLHQLPMWYGFVIAPMIMFLPLINLGKPQNTNDINYNIIIFMVACLGIGNTAVYLGIGDILSQWAVANLLSANPALIIGMIFLMAVGINFIMTPFAAMSTLGSSLAEIALSLNISFYPISYAFFFGCQTIIFPYESALYAILYAFGNIRLSDFIKFMLIRAVLWLAYVVIVGTSYWSFLGYL